jgi:phospholipid/cholesterol/gamma-HCH transport system ATP-binding protein
VILKIKDLTTKFGDKVVHNKLNLEVKKGELLVLLGGSGSGKSTLIDYITDVENDPCFSGKIYWNGKRWDKSDIAYKVGFAPQNGGFFRDYTVGQNIAMPLEYVAKLPRQMSLELAWANMQLLGLDRTVFHQYPYMLSGGMIRRASIARAIVLNQELVILDEPLAGLDPINCTKMIDLIRGLIPGKTVICVTHQFIKADRYALLRDGSLVTGSIEDIKKDKYGAEFMKNFQD